VKPAVLVSLLLAATAAAEPRPGPVAIVGQIGWYHGLAVGGELRLGNAGLRASGGANLIILTLVDADTYSLSSIEVFGTGQLNADAYLFFPLQGGADLGLSVGAKYNTLLGFGIGGAFEVRKQLRPRLGLGVSVGLVYYPDGADRLVEKEGFPPDVEFNFPFGAGLQGGGGVALTFDL
jgi:hypothetical protein